MEMSWDIARMYNERYMKVYMYISGYYITTRKVGE